MSTCASLQNLKQPVQVLLQELYTTTQSEVHAHNLATVM